MLASSRLSVSPHSLFKTLSISIIEGLREKRQLNVFRILRENEAGSSDCHRADAVLCVCDKALIGERY